MRAVLLSCVCALSVGVPVVTTLAGGGAPYGTASGDADGIGSAATFSLPTALSVDGGGEVYVAGYNLIRVVVVATGAVTTVPVGGGGGSTNRLLSIAINGGGVAYVIPAYRSEIRAIVLATGASYTVAGPGNGRADGVGTNAGFYNPRSIAVDRAGKAFVADTYNNVIRTIVLATGSVSTAAGGGNAAGQNAEGRSDGVGTAAAFKRPTSVAVDVTGKNVFVADTGNNLIRMIAVDTGVVATLAGGGGADGTASGRADGVGSAATFNAPGSVAVDSAGRVFVADGIYSYFQTTLVRAIVIATGGVTTVAGGGKPGGIASGRADGVGTAATFGAIEGLAVDGAGRVFVADDGNNLIRMIVVDGTAPSSQPLPPTPPCTQALPPPRARFCLIGNIVGGNNATAAPPSRGLQSETTDYCASFTVACQYSPDCNGQPLGTPIRQFRPITIQDAESILSPQGYLHGQYSNAVICSDADYCNTVAASDACVYSGSSTSASTAVIVGSTVAGVAAVAAAAAGFIVYKKYYARRQAAPSARSEKTRLLDGSGLVGSC